MNVLTFNTQTLPNNTFTYQESQEVQFCTDFDSFIAIFALKVVPIVLEDLVTFTIGSVLVTWRLYKIRICNTKDVVESRIEIKGDYDGSKTCKIYQTSFFLFQSWTQSNEAWLLPP